ncbi:MAG TPA: hypothetical protein VF208_05790 [Candidatus Binatia bacterium]
MNRRPNLRILGMRFGVVLLGAALALNLGCSGLETKPASVDPRERLKEKVDKVIANGELEPAPAQITRFTEAELNSILNSEIAAWIPDGISEPQVRLLGNDRFSLQVVVDIDEFKRRRKRQRSAGPLNFFSGKMPALVRGDLISGDGKGQFKLQSTEVNGIPLPPALALELLSTHTKTRRRPEGVDIQKPFGLPAKIRQLQINPAELVVIQ